MSRHAIHVRQSCPFGCYVVGQVGNTPPSHHSTKLAAKRRRRWLEAQHAPAADRARAS